MLNSSNLRNQQRGYRCTDVRGRTTTTSAIHVVGNDATIDVSIDLDQRVVAVVCTILIISPKAFWVAMRFLQFVNRVFAVVGC